MEVSAQDIIDSVDLNRSEVLLPLYESVVNSIISLEKTAQEDKKIDGSRMLMKVKEKEEDD